MAEQEPIPVVDAAAVAELERAADEAPPARPPNATRPRVGTGEPPVPGTPSPSASLRPDGVEAGAAASPSEAAAPAPPPEEPPTKPPIWMIGPDGVPRIVIDPEEYARDRERLARVERFALHAMNILVCLAELFRIDPREIQQAYAATAAEERRLKAAKASPAPAAPSTTTRQ